MTLVECSNDEWSQSERMSKYDFRGEPVAFQPTRFLAYYAIETTLDLSRGFFGLIMNSLGFMEFWNMVWDSYSDQEISLVQEIALLLDVSGEFEELGLDDFNERISLPAHIESRGAFKQVELNTMRALYKALANQWALTPVSDSLEVKFSTASDSVH